MSRYRFRPRWLPSLATLVILPGLVWLGFWQLERAEHKRIRRERVAAASQAGPRPLDLPLPPRDELLFKAVQVSGVYDASRQYVLANQARDGDSGYRVMTPLRVNGSQTAVLVARDWLPAKGDRTRLPSVPSPGDDATTVTGIATRGPSVGYRMGEAYVGDGGWPRRVTYLDFPRMDAALPYDLVPMVIDPDLETDAGRERLMGGVTPARHIGYAVQWFALAAALLVIYGVTNLQREDRDAG